MVSEWLLRKSYSTPNKCRKLTITYTKVCRPLHNLYGISSATGGIENSHFSGSPELLGASAWQRTFRTNTSCTGHRDRHNARMDIDPKELTGPEPSAADPGTNQRLNTAVAITIALLATFMGVCKVKDDNIVQAMQQAQADKLDHWSFYQARNVRQDLAEATVVQLRLARAGKSPAETVAYDEAIHRFEAKAAAEAQKKQELKTQAERDQATYDQLNYRDDQFDLSDAALAIAISLLAVASLTQLMWMYWLSWVPIGFGVLMGLSGLLGWPLHPDALTRLLS